MGHFERVCLKKYPHLLERKVSSVLVVGANIKTPPQPAVLVKISHSNLPQAIQVKAVADTGAQVCVAGPELLRILKLKPLTAATPYRIT